ncbi:hypothetical protein K5D56_08120 [Pseudomonas cichorii]|uniref:Uncharacterized protein n=1 Tax=Pseudomonas cichorii TaxID=36746 RepID=A0ABQ1DRU9_PSECI|nr:hypothetical protein [Pseudomonas cichorii]AHF68000.1 hypothetical protein PCH70_28470 [Pseudomonas cichorii JBC1]MBX8519036.1 hypothetical protein [Pseudomonas cichorii]MBX8544048.1 hypothetical protein [Pseudomonas cichorii]MBX8561603.1 hypothetical protein [Pseudomonas cichorii]MBX8589332.1 hypothetical protein [Pseudomonas cichorii]
MSITIKLTPLASPAPGRAFLQVRGWEHDAGNLEFAIQRNQDDYYLQHDQQWGNAPCWFAQHFVEDADGDSISYEAGPEIVDPLLLSSVTSIFNFRLRSPDGSAEDENPMRLAPGLNSSLAVSATNVGAAQTTVSLGQPSVIPQPVVEPVAEQPEEVQPLPEPIAEPPTPAKSRTALLLIGVLVLLVIAAGLWFWLKKPVTPEAVAPVTTPAVVAEPVPAPAVAAVPCSIEALSKETELNFVQSCIKQAPDSATLLKVIELAKANKQCGVAQRLYANRAQAGNVEVAQAYAREYDPKYLQPSACFTTADNATAAYWYETILSYQADNAEAAERLKELKP